MHIAQNNEEDSIYEVNVCKKVLGDHHDVNTKKIIQESLHKNGCIKTICARAPKYTNQYVPGLTFRLQTVKKPAYMCVFGCFRLFSAPNCQTNQCRAPGQRVPGPKKT